MKKIVFVMLTFITALGAMNSSCTSASASTAIDSLAMRVTEGTSVGRIIFKEMPVDGEDYFEIDKTGDCVEISGNNYISMAVGLNWYLKYVAGVHITWNNPSQKLPDELPLPESPIRKSTNLKDRYYLNYCTYSYSMPFWDEARWEREIDWMALHGVTMPLAMTGMETVWRNVLLRMGYSDDGIGRFISGPAYMAWWQMNNLEGWGGPLPESWYDRQADLQKKIVGRMRSLGIEPVFPGYAGMVPRNIGEKLGYDIADPGKWCGFPRPAFLSPEDEHFDAMADIYYEELGRLYGQSRYYSMDPFHEGGSTEGVDLTKAGQSIMNAMKRANPDAEWVIQSWQANPRRAMIDTLAKGDIAVLDLYSEKMPKWNRNDGYGKHDWLYCMLLNFGGNIGMHGRMSQLINGFYDAKEQSATLAGIGATPEGIENNPVMYELLFELPWREERFTPEEWIDGYLKARYGSAPSDDVRAAWRALIATVYNAPIDYPGEGTVESLLCARPGWDVSSASTWGYSQLFYDADSTARAAQLMRDAAADYAGNKNFEYDLADISRQANADKANVLLRQMSAAHKRNAIDSVKVMADEFLNLLLEQDSMLKAHRDMNVDTWLDAARNAGTTPAEKQLYVRNAAQLVTVWGDDTAANYGGLHDYSHREWSGLLRDLYYKRWKAFFDWQLNGAPEPDYYKMELDWIDSKVNSVTD